MSKKIESRFEEIIRYYGSVEAYNEEQRRFGLVSVEAVIRNHPFIPERKIAVSASGMAVIDDAPVNSLKLNLWLKLGWPRFFGKKPQNAQL